MIKVVIIVCFVVVVNNLSCNFVLLKKCNVVDYLIKCLIFLDLCFLL